MGHALETLVQRGRLEGPLAVVHCCHLCGKILQTRRKGGGGRGQGMRMGNIGRGLVLQHLKAEHADHPKVLAAYVQHWAWHSARILLAAAKAAGIKET